MVLPNTKNNNLSRRSSEDGSTPTQSVEFHLDATHSFHPKENAEPTLDQLFFDVKNANKSLVV